MRGEPGGKQVKSDQHAVTSGWIAMASPGVIALGREDRIVECRRLGSRRCTGGRLTTAINASRCASRFRAALREHCSRTAASTESCDPEIRDAS